jgi:hypothetical protein
MKIKMEHRGDVWGLWLCLQAVGFDLDYTLAQYRPETFEALAHAKTVSGGHLIMTAWSSQQQGCLIMWLAVMFFSTFFLLGTPSTFLASVAPVSWKQWISRMRMVCPRKEQLEHIHSKICHVMMLPVLSV